jgi:hypothetical protein
MTNQEFASFNPEDHTSGGYLDDKDVTIVESRVVEFDFNGKADPTCCWMVQFRPDGGADDGEDDRTEYYSIGPLTKFTPNSDNTRAVAVIPGAKMNNKSKASMFARSLTEAGVALSADVSILDGKRVHVNVLPLPAFTDKDGNKVDGKTVTAVTALLDGDAPAAKPKAKVKGKAKAKAKAAPAAEDGGSSDTDEAAEGVVMGVLAEGGGTATKAGLPNAAFKAIKDTKVRNPVIKLVASDDWLGAEERPWSYDGGELTLG